MNSTFKVGDFVKLKEKNYWPALLSEGQAYQIKRISSDFIYLIKNDGTVDGFPGFDKHFEIVGSLPEDFLEDEIEKAIAFIQS